MVRARSVEFVQYWSAGGDETTPRMLEIGEQHPELFGAERVDGEAPLGGHAASVLARFDPEFVIAQTRRWGARATAWAKEGARALALYRRDHVLDFLKAASGIEPDQRQRVVDFVESAIERDDSKLAAIVREAGLPLPTKPAPSLADCRRAIGL